MLPRVQDGLRLRFALRPRERLLRGTGVRGVPVRARHAVRSHVVLTADDDATWISYKLEERYNASSVSSSTGGTAMEEEPVRALATEGDDSATGDFDR